MLGWSQGKGYFQSFTHTVSKRVLCSRPCSKCGAHSGDPNRDLQKATQQVGEGRQAAQGHEGTFRSDGNVLLILVDICQNSLNETLKTGVFYLM